MNWKNLTIGKKIGIGFGTVLFILAIVSVWSIFGISDIVSGVKVSMNGNHLNNEILNREIDHLNWASQVSALFTDDSVTELNVQTDPHKCAFGKWYYSDERKLAEEMVPEIKSLLTEIEEYHNKLHASAIEIGKHFHQADTELSAILRDAKTDHLKWLSSVQKAFVDQSIKKIDVESDPYKCAFGKWYYSDEVKTMRKNDAGFDAVMANIEEPHKQLHQSLLEIQKLIDQGKRSQAAEYFRKNTEIFAHTTLQNIDEVIAWNDQNVAGMQMASETYTNETMPALHNVQRILTQVVETVGEKVKGTDDNLLVSAARSKSAVLIFSVIAIIIGVALAVFISHGIINALKKIIEGLSSGSEQVAAAANQVSSSSQQMAEGASEQASSLEEISSSLEEMTSMTKQNADNAKQANTMAVDTSSSAVKGSDAMSKMADAINKIKASSDETAKIIKTIDEIAFQTNLLALNAAVEAARAGEAGMGFAVVAEEVRNLAQRSAEAAKTTSILIEESKNNAENGVVVTQEVDSILKEITESVKKMTQLIGEVSAASEEQAQGIVQVNSAVSQMDEVTQSAAANAEESASASEELSSQAQELNVMVEVLTHLVTKDGKANNVHSSAGRRLKSKPAYALAGKNTTQGINTKGSLQTRKVKAAKIVNPNDIIPLNDDEFEEF
ncbi:MAG: CZB domain-containing protein [Candidatus Latescibacteria bacterium]|nr:CZB domain-containing protein [Candidatus Latescibacterota bacterium]